MKILIAEDDAVTRRLLQSYLQKWGHEVVAASNGLEAWQLFEAGHYPIVMSDWMMPELSGLELIRRIRAAPREGYVYVILVTARAQKEDLVEGMDAGADDFVTKPFDRDELRVRLREGERIVRLEQSLAEQNQALREAEKALSQREQVALLGQRAADVIQEITRPLALVTDHLAALRREVLSAMSLLNKYRAGRDVLAKLEPDLAAETTRLEEDLASLPDKLERLFNEAGESLQKVKDLITSGGWRVAGDR